MKLSDKLNLVLILVFSCVMVLPAADNLFKIDRRNYLNENRELSPAPVLKFDLMTLYRFPGAFQAYFNDHFGLRNRLVYLNYLVKHGLLGVSPSSLVIPGKEGWFYYNDDKSIEDYRGITRFDEDKLKKLLFSFEVKRKWLEVHGIKYLLAIAPNKETVYPEYLPDPLYKRVRNETALDDFIHYFRQYSKVDIIDLRPDLFEAKKDKELYYKTDTHWNNYGAFIGYRRIMQSISQWFPEVRILSLNDFTITQSTWPAGDLAGLMGGAALLKDIEFNFNPLKRFTSYKAYAVGADPIAYAMKKDNASLPRALLLGNSFGVALAPFLAEDFRFVKFYLRHPWYRNASLTEEVNRVKPDIVIEETVERLIKSIPDFVSVQTNESLKLFQDLFKASKKGITIVDARKGEKSTFQHNDQVEIVKTSKGLLIKSSGKNPQIFLPGIKTAPAGYPMLKIDIESSDMSVFQLAYVIAIPPKYKKANFVTVPLKRGNNEIYVPFYRTEFSGNIIINPSFCPGEFLIKSMEIRYI